MRSQPHQGCLLILVKNLGESLCASEHTVQVAKAHKTATLKKVLKTNRPLRPRAEPVECVIICLVSWREQRTYGSLIIEKSLVNKALRFSTVYYRGTAVGCHTKQDI